MVSKFISGFSDKTFKFLFSTQYFGWKYCAVYKKCGLWQSLLIIKSLQSANNKIAIHPLLALTTNLLG